MNTRLARPGVLLALLLLGCVRLMSRPGSQVDDSQPGLDTHGPERDVRLVDRLRAEPRPASDAVLPPDRAKLLDLPKKDVLKTDLYVVSDAQYAACSDFASWSCVTGPYCCSIGCPPLHIECIEDFPLAHLWNCRCRANGALVKQFSASPSLSCNSCRNHIPDCWPIKP